MLLEKTYITNTRYFNSNVRQVIVILGVSGAASFRLELSQYKEQTFLNILEEEINLRLFDTTLYVFPLVPAEIPHQLPPVLPLHLPQIFLLV